MPLLRLDPPIAPPWVADALGTSARDGEESEKEGIVVQICGSADLLFVRTVLRAAADLDDRAFQSGVARCYASTVEFVRSRALRPLRIWNFIPAIRRPSEAGFSRYEVFNAGRQQGYRECYSSDDAVSRRVTASAVGHPGGDFVVHMLASKRACVPVENPRQRPAYLYSARYGPEPPCFSRASRVEGKLGGLGWGGVGLVAGTASIVGEDSLHENDLPAQIQETFRNLATVSSALRGRPPTAEPDAAAISRALAHYQELRVYVVRQDDAPTVANAVNRFFPNLARFELVGAQLCRPELLVEAEGILRCVA